MFIPGEDSESTLKFITTLEDLGLLLNSSREWHTVIKRAIMQLEAYIYMLPMVPLSNGSVLNYVVRQHLYLAGCAQRQSPLEATQPTPLCACISRPQLIHQEGINSDAGLFSYRLRR